jgi:hypothetical protein
MKPATLTFVNVTAPTWPAEARVDSEDRRRHIPQIFGGGMTMHNIWDEIHELKKTRRASLMQLRPRHLEKVDRIAKRPHFDRADMHDFLLENYDRLFGVLRRTKREAVPSDKLRQSLMISALLDRVQMRRDELEEDAANRGSK